MSARWLLGTTLLIAACDREPQSDALETRAAADTVGCDLVPTMLHPNPDSLIAEFVARNAAGAFQQGTGWFNTAVDCPGHEPGPDIVTEAIVHHIREIDRTLDAVQKEVLWGRLSHASGDSVWESLGLEYDTLKAVRTAYGWRVQSPALKLRVPPIPADTSTAQ